ncbi:MAG: winged helix-turn-helix domain-containing protein [Acidobacteriaceae bacterium]|nr:winged helix-turn-helix domain-containing protein [Acidobacteriaceae bacterium]
MVRKSDLLSAVWPDSFVEEGILAVHISHLRKALGGRQYIETVARSGYRWASDVAARRLCPVHTSEVHELLGRGRTHLLAASMSDAPKAVAAFQAAIASDPNYAAAYAGLALAWCAQAELRTAPHCEAYQQAKAAALAALALDALCADAQIALGIVLFLSEWNWIGAERSLRRALSLNPNHTEAYLVCGRLMEALGQLDEGLQLKQKGRSYTCKFRSPIGISGGMTNRSNGLTRHRNSTRATRWPASTWPARIGRRATTTATWRR